MLTTLIVPTGGRAWVSGLDVAANPVGVKRRIGVVTQNNTLDMQLTVAENLEFRGRFFGLGAARSLPARGAAARGVRAGRPEQGDGHRSVRRAGQATADRPGPGTSAGRCCSWTSRPPAFIRKRG